MRNLTPTALFAIAAFTLAPSCGSPQEPSSALAQRLAALDTPAPRLLLAPLLPRLRARADAKEAAWVALQQQCDALSAPGVAFNPPSGNAYPNAPAVGQGYQGDGYLAPLLGLALCYRITGSVTYGNAGSRLLDVIATPEAEGGGKPSYDTGYGIRNYGFGIALAYDWLRPVLSDASKTRARTTLAAWVTWFDASGFTRNAPATNYFAGYLAAKTAAAIALEGDEPASGAWWNDLQNRLWPMTKAAYNKGLAGGGWPEGWGYGSRAVQAVVLAQRMAATGKGAMWEAELPLAAEEARYLPAFTWPALTRMDDQGTVRSGNPLRPSATLAGTIAFALEAKGDPNAPAARGFARELAGLGDDREPWQKLLLDDPALPASDWRARPASYEAAGLGYWSSRSTWLKDAAWGALSAGPYVGAVDMGEQLFNQGEFALVRGGTPLIIRPTGWLPQIAGNAGEDIVYADGYEAGTGGRRRQLYNTFFAVDSGNTYSPGQGAQPAALTHLERAEEGAGFARVRGAQIEQAYRAGVGSFTRDVVHLRPDTFVIRDSTTVVRADADRWLAFHFASAPALRASTDATERVFSASGVSGHILFPKNAETSLVTVLAPVTRLEVRPPARALADSWLTVFVARDPGTTPVNVERVEDPGVMGANVQSASRNQVAAFLLPAALSATPPTAGQATTYRVTPTADADHVLFDVPVAPEGYAVTAVVVAGKLTITAKRGGIYKASPGGTLSFSVTRAGVVAAPSWAAPPTPVPPLPVLDAGAPDASPADAGRDSGLPPQVGCDAGPQPSQQCLLPCVSACAASCGVKP